MHRYIETVRCLQESPNQIQATEQAAKAFLEEQGPQLHEILTARDKLTSHLRKMGEGTSYVQPFWDHMYLGGRYPVNINSNPALMLTDLPVRETGGQLGVAAAISNSVARWYLAKLNGIVDPDFVDKKKTVPQCMEEYEFVFGTTRIPRYMKDEKVVVPDVGHVAVLRGGKVYKVAVTDGNQKVVSPTALEGVFQSIIGNDAHPDASEFIGVLASQERNWWAAERSELEHNPVNKSSLKVVDEALFVVVLDHIEPRNGHEFFDWVLKGDGSPRWWDKVCFLVSPSGRLGVNFEHSPYDGMTLVRLCEDTWHHAADLPLPNGRPDFLKCATDIEALESAEELPFELSPRTKEAIKHATKKFKSFNDITKCHILDFKKFGKNEMKSWKMSPDGVCQAAFQLAYARLHGTDPISAYESCSTKRFLRGRTEAIRPVTQESRDFVAAMVENKADATTLRSLLEASANKHRAVATDCSQGNGVDRHLFSLLSIASDLGISHEIKLFQDPLWTKLNTAILSTSSLQGASIRAFGFGAVCPQGYGLGYNVNDDSLVITVSNFVGEPDTGGSGFGGVSLAASVPDKPTNNEEMAAEIARAFEDIRDIVHKSAPKSSL